MSDDVCPHCGRGFPPKFYVGGLRRQAMVDYIARNPQGVTVWQIIDAVYADDPNGGPEDHNIVSVMAKAANKKLEGLGWRIKGTGGPGSTYSLQKVESSWQEMWARPFDYPERI
jgi:hypothetical protein